jgi:hypothetical protein
MTEQRGDRASRKTLYLARQRSRHRRVGATHRKGFVAVGLHPPYERLTRGRAQYSKKSRLLSVPSVPSVMAAIKLKCRLDLRSASGVSPVRIIRPIRPIRHDPESVVERPQLVSPLEKLHGPAVRLWWNPTDATDRTDRSILPLADGARFLERGAKAASRFLASLRRFSIGWARAPQPVGRGSRSSVDSTIAPAGRWIRDVSPSRA